MSNKTALGILLSSLRDNRGLSLRELSLLSQVDHTYIHRLEVGEKDSPSDELLTKLLRGLKADARISEVAYWLIQHNDTNPQLVTYFFEDQSVTPEIFVAAASMKHRGVARPDPKTLIERIKIIWED